MEIGDVDHVLYQESDISEIRNMQLVDKKFKIFKIGLEIYVFKKKSNEQFASKSKMSIICD